MDNVYSGDVSAAALAAIGIGSPLGYALASGFDALKLKGVTLEIASGGPQAASCRSPMSPRRARCARARIWRSWWRSPAITAWKFRKPCAIACRSARRSERCYVTASDGMMTNLIDLQSAMSSPAHSAAQVLEMLNKSARQQQDLRSHLAHGAVLHRGRPRSAGPAAVARHDSVARTAGRQNLLNWRGSKVAEIEIPAGDSVVTGSKTVQVEVKE